MDKKRIGAFIKDVRREKGLTQEQFAEKLGVSQKSVSRWETGKTMPDYSLLASICDVLEINAAELLGAERIDGDIITKQQATDMTRTLISLVSGRHGVRKIVGAVLSAVIMLVCAVGLYNYEFSVSVDSTTDLEKAVNEYHFDDEVSADILEMQAVGNRLYVLYGEKEYPGACGLACLEKGIFGSYRIIGCTDSKYRWINGEKITVGNTKYLVTYCADDLQNIDAYGICGVRNERASNLTVEDSFLLYKLDYSGSPFLTFTEIDDGVTVSPYYFKYYQNGVEIEADQLEAVLGAKCVEGAPNSGTSSAELGMFYVLEAIIILLGIIFIRYFLIDVKAKQA